MVVPARYTRTAIALHWVIAVLIVTNVLLMWTLDFFPKGAERPMVNLHKSIGITVLLLVVMRVLWRLTHRPPPLPAGYPRWEKLAAHSAHAVLYVLIFLMPLTGWIHDSAWKDGAAHPLNLFVVIPWFRIGAIQSLDPATKDQVHSLFGAVHESLGYVLVAFFVIHVVGALKHQFIDREPELQRMLPGE